MVKSKLNYLGGHTIVSKGGRWSSYDPAETRNTPIGRVKKLISSPQNTPVKPLVKEKLTKWQQHVCLTATAKISGLEHNTLPTTILKKLEKRKWRDQFDSDVHKEILRLIVLRKATKA